jgi:hypothetical protein
LLLERAVVEVVGLSETEAAAVGVVAEGFEKQEKAAA